MTTGRINQVTAGGGPNHSFGSQAAGQRLTRAAQSFFSLIYRFPRAWRLVAASENSIFSLLAHHSVTTTDSCTGRTGPACNRGHESTFSFSFGFVKVLLDHLHFNNFRLASPGRKDLPIFSGPACVPVRGLVPTAASVAEGFCPRDMRK